MNTFNLIERLPTKTFTGKCARACTVVKCYALKLEP